VISKIFEQENPTKVLELGGYLGYSAILFAHVMKTTLQQLGGKLEDLKVWSLEMNPEFAGIARKLIELAGMEDFVEVVVGPAEESLRKLVSEGIVKSGDVDLVFLDHVEELYVQDFKVCQELGLLKKGTVVVADNVVRPGAPEYRALVRGLSGVESIGVMGLITPGDFEVSLSLVSAVHSSA
jgi:catechol O-methyltransferase